MKISQKKILPVIKLALKEDIGREDVTSKLTIPSKKKIKAAIAVKEKGVICGLDVARLVFKTVDKKIRFYHLAEDGKKVTSGRTLARLEGNAQKILKAERVALNFLSHLSGIATLTERYVQRVKAYPVRIMDTRKTTPGLRVLEKYAVRCGSGFNHRMNLSDQILIKDSHLVVTTHNSQLTSLKELIRKIKKKKPKKLKIEIEVKNLRQFKQALKTNPDIIMLDNMSIKEIKKAVQLRNQRPETRDQKLEVSGRVNLKNVRKIASCGVDIISVGALTHSSKALDITLNCE